MKYIHTALIFSVFFLFSPMQSFAAELRYPLNAEDSNTAMVVLKDEVINDNLYIVGKDVTVSGIINGNLYAAGGTVVMNGEVKGDIIVLGGEVTISGKVDGSVHSFGGDVLFVAESAVQKDVTNISGSFMIDTGTSFGRDVIFLGSNADIKGKIGGYIIGRGETIHLSGSVGSYADLEGDEVGVSKEANIVGNLNVKTQAKDLVSGESQVGGTRTVTVIPVQKQAGIDLLGGFRKSLTLLLVALFFVYALPKKANAVVQEFKQSIGSNILWGLLVFFATIPVSLILLFTGVTFPFSVALIGGYIVFLYVAGASVALFVGHKVLGLLKKKSEKIGVLDAVLGVLVMWIFAMIPVIGGLLEGVLVVYALGVLFSIDRRLYAVVKNTDLSSHIS